MSSSATEFVLTYEGVSADYIQSEVDSILAELADPASEAVAAAHKAGLDPDALSGSEVAVRSTRSGFDPSTILVGIVVAAGSSVAETLWKEVIWPRLRRGLHLTTYEERPSARRE